MNGRFSAIVWRRVCTAVVILLCTVGYAAPDVQAQDTRSSRDRRLPPGVVALDETQRDSVRTALRRGETESRTAARQWASTRRVPRRIAQRDGATIQLVGVQGQRPLYLTSLNRKAAQVTRTAALQSGPRLRLTGRGYRIGVWDAGHALPGHQELGARLVPQDDGLVDEHGTHVTGTIGAKGIRPEARGMANEALLLQYDWTDDTTELLDAGGDGLLVSNHSYGPIAGWFYGDAEGTGDAWYWLGDPRISTTEDFTFGWYSEAAARFDQIVQAEPLLLPVVAAGNDRTDAGPRTGTYRALNASGVWTDYSADTQSIPKDGGLYGYDTISGAAVAKNVLTVGSIGMDGDGTLRVSPFSSFGPTDDGRIKPDLVGFGEQVFSTSARGTNQYRYMSGTSMASPNVAGSLLLLQEHHERLTGAPLTAAALKAIALHTAEDRGRPGPDYATGWGLLRTEDAAAQISDLVNNPLAVSEQVLDPNGTFAERLTSDGGDLRVTIAWTDAPASRGRVALDDRTPLLVNDLDLRLVHEATGTTYRPFVLDPARPEVPAVPGDNVRDPVEQILVHDAPAGTYRLSVTHKGTLAGDRAQPFAIVVSGATNAGRPLTIGSAEATPEIGAVALRWTTALEREAGTFYLDRVPVLSDSGDDVLLGAPERVATLAVTGAGEAGQTYTVRDEGMASGRYRYRIVYDGAAFTYVATEVDVEVPFPDAFAALSAYPNPFNEATRIVLDLPEAARVQLHVYDALGRQVASVFDGPLPGGRHTFEVDEARAWASGVYFARFTTLSGAVQTQRLVKAR